ncbi:alpha/beta hydrolase [Brasilonema sp. UFV-L1]|uniref:alpha/beta hydrolase n=1 Tax=Brasilonema sp. UFV-L1 TaxID=2234130 RepID=UPI00145CBA34|nr:alpha/beta hydrolase [Brasilonema sp. UFV-L1]NMG08661.1 alpha/beta hydrolase [Brasilonema sp. UFV-L1]
MSSNISCLDVYLPVALAPGEPAQYEVYGQLCGQLPLENRTVHVLVHGGAYSHIYWDWPYQPERYSYVHVLTNAGYVTFNIDRIGIGKSSHPPAEQVTLEAHAYVLHQINQALRDGKIGGVEFKRIVNVGRSFGALTVISAVSKYGGVEGVIITGLLNVIKRDIVAETIPYFKYPVELDPCFKDKNIPSGYLTTKPGVRGQLFYNQEYCDPEVIALDEATKETVTPPELGIDISVFELEKEIRVPVLVVIGQNDIFFCTTEVCACNASVAANELPFFSPEACLQTFVLPKAGHNINLHLNAHEWFEAARRWSDQFVGA